MMKKRMLTTETTRSILLIYSILCRVTYSFSPIHHKHRNYKISTVTNNKISLLGATTSSSSTTDDKQEPFNSAHEYINELVSLAWMYNSRQEDIGIKYNFDDDDKVAAAEQSLFIQKGKIKSLLTVGKLSYWLTWNNVTALIEEPANMVSEIFANQAKILCNPNHYDTVFKHDPARIPELKYRCKYCRVGRESLVNGMFLSLEELEEKKTTYSLEGGICEKNSPKYEWVPYAVIVTQEFSKDNNYHIDQEGSTPIILLNTLPVVNNMDTFQVRENATYRGHVVNESESSVTCIIPLFLEADNYECDFGPLPYKDYNCELICLTLLWSKCQENLSLPEGVVLADGLIPESLHQKLMQQIDMLASNTEADYHPHSNGIVRDLVSLFLCRGRVFDKQQS